MLNRINLANGNVAAITAGLCTLGYGFWLSPGGTTVYYRCKNHSDLYAVNSDGTNSHVISSDGVPIGYDANNQLMIVRRQGNLFLVVASGAQRRVVLADIAPGAISLCDNNVPPGIVPICDSSMALAPLGKTLVAEAGYPDGNYGLLIWRQGVVCNW